MKPNPICITKQKLLFENEGERERERDIEKKGTGEIPYTNLCCVFLLCFMLLSLSVPLFFVLSMSLLCVYLLSFSVSASLFFFSLPSSLFFWIMADQLSFGSLFFSFQSFLIGNGRLGGFLASRGLPLYVYIYIKYFLVSPYYLVHNSVTSICIAVQVYVPITLFMAHFFLFSTAIKIFS